jgi:hypothetical protein
MAEVSWVFPLDKDVVHATRRSKSLRSWRCADYIRHRGRKYAARASACDTAADKLIYRDKTASILAVNGFTHAIDKSPQVRGDVRYN